MDRRPSGLMIDVNEIYMARLNHHVEILESLFVNKIGSMIK
jgi:hypothetical protein